MDTNKQHPLRGSFKDNVDNILKEQCSARGNPPAGPKGEVRSGWTWGQADSIELIAALAAELVSLAEPDGSIKPEDMTVFKDLINLPVNPSAFRQRLEAKQRIPKGEGKVSLKASNADLF